LIHPSLTSQHGASSVLQTLSTAEIFVLFCFYRKDAYHLFFPGTLRGEPMEHISAERKEDHPLHELVKWMESNNT
jgi:hypothetical protein